MYESGLLVEFLAVLHGMGIAPTGADLCIFHQVDCTACSRKGICGGTCHSGDICYASLLLRSLFNVSARVEKTCYGSSRGVNRQDNVLDSFVMKCILNESFDV